MQLLKGKVTNPHALIPSPEHKHFGQSLAKVPYVVAVGRVDCIGMPILWQPQGVTGEPLPRERTNEKEEKVGHFGRRDITELYFGCSFLWT